MRVAYFSLRLFLLSKCSILITNYKKRRGGEEEWREGGRERGRQEVREGRRLRNEVLAAYMYNPSTWR